MNVVLFRQVFFCLVLLSIHYSVEELKFEIHGIEDTLNDVDKHIRLFYSIIPTKKTIRVVSFLLFLDLMKSEEY